MQARYYDPVIGRFYSNDPVGFRDVHSFNRYAYANNNPYKYTDPTGKIPLLIPVIMFIAKEIAAEAASQATGGATDILSTRRMATKGFKHVAKAMARGRASETRVLKRMDLGKNNDKVTTSEGNSIPDAMTDSLSVEVKDTKVVSLTKQLRIQTQAAKASGRQSVLVTGKNTKISGPAEKAFDVIIREKDLGPKK